MQKLLKWLLTFCLILLIGWGLSKTDLGTFIPAFFKGNASVESGEPIGDQEPKGDASSGPATADGLQTLPANPFAEIDQYAGNSPTSAESDIPTLAGYLEQKAGTDLEKARAIYVWLTENIRYDDQAFNNGITASYQAEEVLRSRKAVCEGFSNLFLALAREMGLETEKVSGYAKGYGYSPVQRFSRANHAWNIVKIDGQWKIFDATWGEGNGTSVNDKLVSKKEFDDYWFNVDPYEAIFSHYPEDPAFSFVRPLLSLSDYIELPNVGKGYFEMGFDGQETFAVAHADPDVIFPETFEYDTYLKVIAAPNLKRIEKDQVHEFEFFVPRGIKLALIDAANNWEFFDRAAENFQLSYRPRENGPLKIGVQHEKSGRSFDIILVYEVVEGLAS